MPKNPAILWGQLVVDALAQSGLSAVCIAPGSRSTPLTLAFAAHPHIKVYPHLDERSAAFFALGLALATDKPVALVCSSGTAVANFLPAIIEAKQAHVPLLILTADRPPELRQSGANQTIDQVKIYGDSVLWAVDVALPETDAQHLTTRSLSTLASRAYAVANGMPKGPVHLNFPFRKPLEPMGDSAESPPTQQPNAPQIVRGAIHATPQQISDLATILNAHERGWIICGPSCERGDFANAVAALSERTGYPIFADALSGVRFPQRTNIITNYETFLANKAEPLAPPEVIVRFGAVPTSKWLNNYVANCGANERIHIRENGVWADDSHLTTCFLQANATALCEQILASITPRKPTSWLTDWVALDQNTRTQIRTFMTEHSFDAAFVSDTVGALPAGTQLVVGNSLSVRHVDDYAQSDSAISVYGNRGASGIDGNISTMLGVAAGGQNPTVLICGDVTFYHDLNGLLSGRSAETPVTIILLNNDGGGIFRRLPIAKVEPPFTDLFLTPHGLDFSHAAHLFGWQYDKVESRHDFQSALQNALTNPQPNIIEVTLDGERDLALRQQMVATILKENERLA